MRPLIESVVDDIYQAAIDGSHLPAMFEAVCHCVGASRGIIMLLGKDSLISHTYNIDPELMVLYNTVYSGADPFYNAARERNVRHIVMTGQELRPTKSFERTDYYHDCLKPAGIYDCMSITLEESSAMNAGIAIQRSKDEPLFNHDDKAILASLVPHLRRMVSIRRKFEQQASLTALHTSAADRLDFGVILLDSDGKTTFTNHAADRILSAGDGLSVRHGRLVALHDQGAFAQAVTLACDGESPSGSEVCIRRDNGKSPYVIQIVPTDLNRNGPFLLTPLVHQRGAIVAITDPDLHAEPPVAVLREMFGLTPAESAITLQLCTGLTIAEIAVNLGINECTARWHLKNIQLKTDTHRQSELVALMSRISLRLTTDN